MFTVRYLIKPMLYNKPVLKILHLGLLENFTSRTSSAAGDEAGDGEMVAPVARVNQIEECQSSVRNIS